MRAVPVDKPVGAGLVLVEDEVLAHQAHRLHRRVVQLGDRGDGHPVAAQQLAHQRAGADLRQRSVLFVAKHRFGFFISLCQKSLEVSLEIPAIDPYDTTNSGSKELLRNSQQLKSLLPKSESDVQLCVRAKE